MNQTTKQKIADGALSYAKSKGLSNNQVAQATGVNSGYISSIFRNNFTNEVAGKTTPIGDRWFLTLAKWAGVELEKQYWKNFHTRQFKEIISRLEAAKEDGSATMIIAPTGLGKTNAVDVFVNKNPLHTYRITVARYYKLEDILDELISRLGIEANDSIAKRMDGRSIKRRIDKIVNKLIEIKYAGGNPMIILDESENLIVSVLQTIKGLYDALVNNCALVMIGTEQLLEGLLNTRTRNRTSVPQLYRRFKANTLYVSKLNKKIDFKPFFDEYVTDKGLQTLLCALCDNYGELHDYLEPTLKECGSKNIELTEEFFRLKWNENRFQIVRA